MSHADPITVEDERVRDLAADCGVPPEWVVQAAIEKFFGMDSLDQVLAIETARDDMARRLK